MVQKLVTPLVESNVVLEPRTPSAMPVGTWLQRAWSMVLGRRENTLQPVYADRAGLLGVVPLDLNGWTMVYDEPYEQGWTDLGRVVDLVLMTVAAGSGAPPTIGFGMDGATVLQHVGPITSSQIFIAAAWCTLSTIVFHGQARWYYGGAGIHTDSRVMAYTAPER